VGCIALLIYRKRQPKEETYASRVEQISTLKTTSTNFQQSKILGPKQGQHVTTDDVKSFLDAYEDRKQLKSEIKSMDLKAQKGKIPRRQYKVQRKAIENRIDNLSKTINRKRHTFIASSSTYSDLARQLDLAEEDLAEAEENLKILEHRQSKGEISIETFKKNTIDYQKQKDKAEAAINGILLRLREKTR
jgi:predicted  nucleic acid-binding Zn-ribbon protein